MARGWWPIGYLMAAISVIKAAIAGMVLTGMAVIGGGWLDLWMHLKHRAPDDSDLAAGPAVQDVLR